MDDRKESSRFAQETGRYSSAYKRHFESIREETQSEYWSDRYRQILQGIIKQIDRLMEFRPESELSRGLKDCFDGWYDYYSLKEEGELADTVLSAFYQSGRIADLLRNLQTFAEEIDPQEDAGEIRLEAYHNYIFYLRRQVGKLVQRYREEGERPPQELPPRKASTVLWFVKNECGDIAAVKDLPAARKRALGLLGKYPRAEGAEYNVRKRVKLSEEDRNDLQFILSARDLLSAELDSGRPNRELEEKTRIYLEKTAARKKNIEESQAVMRTISQVLTPEWFAAWDPGAEGNAISQMDSAGLQAFYLQQLEQIPV